MSLSVEGVKNGLCKCYEEEDNIMTRVCKVTHHDIVMAYRKAKVDAWYSQSLDANAVIEFENNFEDNVNEIVHALNKKNCDFTDDWLGSWTFQAKKFTSTVSEDKGVTRALIRRQKGLGDQDSATFRLMALPSVRFHILSALWLLKTGYKFDGVLSTCSYGNRLRAKGTPNVLASGSFKYYISNFKSWKGKCIDTLINELGTHVDEEVAVISADATSFYHALRPDFLLEGSYLKTIGVRLDDYDKWLTRILIKAMNVWAKGTPLRTGLPVGLPASAVIANMALWELDYFFENKLGPKVLYYGRYVDDILLVLKNNGEFSSLVDVWQWLAVSSRNLLKTVPEVRNGNRNTALCYTPRYAEQMSETLISFSGDKCRMVLLDVAAGLPYVEKMKSQIDMVSSEFRLMPECATDAKEVAKRLRRLVTKEGEDAGNFRKIDSLQIRKAEFTSVLHQMKFLAEALEPEVWKKPRVALLKEFRQFVLSAVTMPDYERYLSRVVRMGVRSGDYKEIASLYKHVMGIVDVTQGMENVYIASPLKLKDGVLYEDNQKLHRAMLERWRDSIETVFCDSVFAAFNPEFKYGFGILSQRIPRVPRYRATSRIARQYVAHDLAECKFIEHTFHEEMRPLNAQLPMEWMLHTGESCPFIEDIITWFGDVFTKGLNSLQRFVYNGTPAQTNIPYAFLFPTRPVTVSDLFILSARGRSREDFRAIIKAYRGYSIDGQAKAIETILSPGTRRAVAVDNDVIDCPLVALMNIETKWSDVCTMLRPQKRKNFWMQLRRFSEIIKLINEVLREEKHIRPHYIIFHELALPQHWLRKIASICCSQGVSVISGIDYVPTRKRQNRSVGYCSNQLWMALSSKRKEFYEMFFLCEDKQQLTPREEVEIKKLGYIQDPAIKNHSHRIIKHGNFVFSTLICSELTDIANRVRLRGRVDALIAVSWNQDLHTFSSIIESAASDIHAYVVLCNNREYGDSRIRVPAVAWYKRDLIQIRGGVGSYYVIGKMDVDTLRRFQKNHIPCQKALPGDEFKPLPMGFEMSPDRS